MMIKYKSVSVKIISLTSHLSCYFIYTSLTAVKYILLRCILISYIQLPCNTFWWSYYFISNKIITSGVKLVVRKQWEVLFCFGRSVGNIACKHTPHSFWTPIHNVEFSLLYSNQTFMFVNIICNRYK